MPPTLFCSIFLACGSCASVASPTVSWRLPIRLAAGFSALFFALHPLQVEVVAWAIGREMAIAGFFFILTLLCYLKAAENESVGSSPWGWMGVAWFLYALSLLGKEAALTLPFALLVLDVYPLRRLRGGPTEMVRTTGSSGMVGEDTFSAPGRGCCREGGLSKGAIGNDIYSGQTMVCCRDLLRCSIV